MSQRQLRAAVAAIVLVPLLGFPALVLAQGGATFPSRDDCARPAVADSPDLDVVYGRLDDPVVADDLLARLTATGFVGAKIERDACGRWKVFYDAIESLAQGQALAAQVREAGFEAGVELGS